MILKRMVFRRRLLGFIKFHFIKPHLLNSGNFNFMKPHLIHNATFTYLITDLFHNATFPSGIFKWDGRGYLRPKQQRWLTEFTRRTLLHTGPVKIRWDKLLFWHYGRHRWAPRYHTILSRSDWSTLYHWMLFCPRLMTF